MKYLVLSALLLLGFGMNAQNPCEYSTNVNDSIGSYKNTKDYLVYERNFSGTSANLFFSLALTDGLPTLNMQFIQKSKDFMKANCLDKNSRMYLQLDNGKIATLIHIDQDICGTSLGNDTGYNHRVMSGYFMFTKDAFELLKSSPVSLMRIRYTTETVDYILKEELKSELDGKTYSPGTYFMDTIRCIEN